MNRQSLTKSVIIILCITIFSKFSGFFRDSLIAKAFGATYMTDAYTISMTIPNMVYDLFGTAVTMILITVLSNEYKNKGKEAMFSLANSLINLFLKISLVIFVICWILSPYIIKVMAPTYTGELLSISILLTKISLINILFMSLISGFIAILQTLDNFVASSLTGLVISVPIIIYIVLNKSSNIVTLTIITMIGYSLQILIQIPWLISNKFKYKFKTKRNNKIIMESLRSIWPVVIGSGVSQINFLINRSIASGLQEGSIASFDFASKINNLAYGIFALSIITAIFPTLNRAANYNEYNKLKEYINKSICNINVIMIPCVGLTIIMRVPIICLLFKHGVFDDRAVGITSQALLYLSFGTFFVGIREVCNRAFYALKDTITPMINGVVGVVLCIIMNFFLVKIMDIGGLALSVSLSISITTFGLVINLRKKITGVYNIDVIKSSIKIIISTIIMCLGVFFIKNNLFSQSLTNTEYAIEFFVCGFIGSILYILMLKIFNVSEYYTIVKKISVKIQGRRLKEA